MVWGGVYTGGNISADWNKRWQNGQYEGHCHVLLFVCFNWKWREIENCKIKKGIKVHVKFVLPVLHDEYSTMFCRKQNKLNFFFPFSYFVQAGTQISLADLSLSDETCTLWYNLLPCKQSPGKKPKEHNDEYMFLLSKQSQSLDSLDLVSDMLAITVLARKMPESPIVSLHCSCFNVWTALPWSFRALFCRHFCLEWLCVSRTYMGSQMGVGIWQMLFAGYKIALPI